MEEKIKKLEDQAQALKEQVQKLRNIAWVIGVVAVIFGVSGGWGINVLGESQKTIKNLEGSVEKLSQDTDVTRQTYASIRKSEQEKFDQYISQKESEFNKNIETAVISFAAKECPNGWQEYTPAYGRFIRGIDKHRNTDPDGLRVPGSEQGDALQNHRHKHGSSEWPNGGMYNTVRSQFAGGNENHKTGDFGIKEPVGENVRIADETRPKNIALLFCIKSQ